MIEEIEIMANVEGYKRDIYLGTEHHSICDETVTNEFILDMAIDYERDAQDVVSDMKAVAKEHGFSIRFA